MIDLLAFALVATALGLPFIVNFLWGQFEQPTSPRAT